MRPAFPFTPHCSPLTPSCSPITPFASPLTPAASPFPTESETNDFSSSHQPLPNDHRPDTSDDEQQYNHTGNDHHGDHDDNDLTLDERSNSSLSTNFKSSLTPASFSSVPRKSSLKPLVSLMVKPTSQAGKAFVKPAVTTSAAVTTMGRATNVSTANLSTETKEERPQYQTSKLKTRILSLLQQPCCEVWSEGQIRQTLKQADPDDCPEKQVGSSCVCRTQTHRHISLLLLVDADTDTVFIVCVIV